MLVFSTRQTVGGRSRGHATTETAQQRRELSVDGGGRVFQICMGRSSTKDGTVGGLGTVHSFQRREEDTSKIADGRRRGILQHPREKSVERPRRA